MILEASCKPSTLPRVDTYRLFERGEPSAIRSAALAKGPLDTGALALRFIRAKGMEIGLWRLRDNAVAVKLIFGPLEADFLPLLLWVRTVDPPEGRFFRPWSRCGLAAPLPSYSTPLPKLRRVLSRWRAAFQFLFENTRASQLTVTNLNSDRISIVLQTVAQVRPLQGKLTDQNC